MGSQGHIVNIGSLAGFTPFTNSAAYCASKYGLVGFTLALSMELRAEGREGLRVTLIHPGSTDTGLWDGRTGFRARYAETMMRPAPRSTR